MTTTHQPDPVANATPAPASSQERRLALAAAIYAVLGLLAGAYYRTLTHSLDFTGPTTLSIVHTHLLALGMLVTLAVLAMERLFKLSQSRAYKWFEPLYHAAMAITVGSFLVRGTLQVVATNPTSMAFSGVAGLGHTLLLAAFVILFWSLRTALRRK